MAADVKIVHSTDDPEMWRVAVNGQYLVGFYGFEARAHAERHREELVEILNSGNSSDALMSSDLDGLPSHPSASRSARSRLIN